MARLPSDLLSELADPARRRVRENLIAAATATEVECPHCHAGIGHACVTFPRGTDAQFTHARRLKLRHAQVTRVLR